VTYSAGATLVFTVGIDLGEIPSGNPLDYIFLKNVSLSGNAGFNGLDLTATAGAGGLTIGIIGGTASGSAAFSFELKDPNTAGSPSAKSSIPSLRIL
jgi:hypothetical protein